MTELVVLAAVDGSPIGAAPKASVHTEDTPLHLAFSAWVVREGKVLMTRRALGKITWPGVWTNSFCGHPGPEEPTVNAVERRAAFELGLKLKQEGAEVECVLPGFSYRAVDASGVVEHEICPVYVVRVPAGTEAQFNPDEVCEHAWVGTAELCAAVDATPFAFSPWLVEELAHPELRAALQR